MQTPKIRAMQHLMLQGFTLYTSESVDALRAVGSSTLEDPEHHWAMVLGDMVQCNAYGSQLLIPLEPTMTRDARMRIEAAVALGKSPPAERLEAFSDEFIEREARKRGIIAR